MESELRVSVDRICELEALTGTPKEFSHSRPSVWDTLGALSKSIERGTDESNSRIHDGEDKIAKFSVGVNALTKCIYALLDELDRLSERVENVAYGEGREVHDTKLVMHGYAQIQNVCGKFEVHSIYFTGLKTLRLNWLRPTDALTR